MDAVHKCREQLITEPKLIKASASGANTNLIPNTHITLIISSVNIHGRITANSLSSVKIHGTIAADMLSSVKIYFVVSLFSLPHPNPMFPLRPD